MLVSDNIQKVPGVIHELTCVFFLSVDLNDDNNDKSTNSNEPNIPSYAPIVIRIDFKLEDPRAGIVFVEPEDEIAPYVSLNDMDDHAVSSRIHLM